ncbi:bifunctional G-protein beta WD-40 repeat/LIS1 homology motif/WD40 repeat/WD40 repeat-containing protein SMU1/WD40-repeat-containing domain superfamily/Anaphase-promoting complex subunit 4 [Babesia duncani]|uniref:WD40 repeat-containing protein SMU1 n=1 Tax=Babesia duncani TaxID=323732 RepID=A0AAD9UPP1_9APIC|nr:bifunctional G-protein beta WD-40 repeat/LIS1 homology motif/WD40 repeat/WD40 repeat-containing protein SMU1/WD40-repeat-containing domain superfamily/Anaphase-promoting complex subunit 4 [Babesia duncani]
MDRTVNVASEDVIKIILQYLKENGLTRSLWMLQEESGVSLNSVPNVEAVVSDVEAGRWNKVLDAIDTMMLSQETLFKLYDQIIRELVDLKESKLAKLLMENVTPLLEMRQQEPENYRRLSDLCANRPANSKEIYAGLSALGSQHSHLTREKRRTLIGEALKAEIALAPQSRLLALIGNAIKWQHHLGIIPNVDQFDVFKNTSTASDKDTEFCVSTVSKIIRFGDNCNPECVTFTPNGNYLISGSSDGFIEVWNWSLGVLDTDLEYQKKDQFMLHDTLVVSLAVSRDSEILASGSKDGQIKIWRLSSGECLRIIDGAHEEAVVCITFSKDSMNILTGSFDTTVRIHGLKSGKTLKQFNGHTSIVNSAFYLHDDTKVISGSSDGFIKIWDAKSGECQRSFAVSVSEPQIGLKSAIPINKALMISSSSSSEPLLLVCTRSSCCTLVNTSGKVIRTFELEEGPSGKDFIDIAASRRCGWVYCLSQDNCIYCFNAKNGKFESIIQAHESEAIGIFHHPTSSLLTSWGLDGTIKLYYP